MVPPAGPFPWLLLTENAGAGEDERDPTPPCIDPDDLDDDPLVGRWGTLWFELTPEVSGRYRIATCGSTADTVLAAWTGFGPTALHPHARQHVARQVVVADLHEQDARGVAGPHATDLIAEAVLGMDLGMTVDQLSRAIHPHPTLSEAVMESALSLCGGAIHMP